MIAHRPELSCHRTLRRPFGKRGIWGFPVPRSESLKREQRRESLKREMQRMVVHARWAARKAYEHIQFEAREVPGLARGLSIARKRPSEDVAWMLQNSEWLATEFRKLGVDATLVPYATRITKSLCGVQ